jgi:hypothetical protein
MRTLKCDRCGKLTGTAKEWMQAKWSPCNDGAGDDNPFIFMASTMFGGERHFTIHICPGCFEMVMRVLVRSKFGPDTGEGPVIEVDADLVRTARRLCDIMGRMPTARTQHQGAWVHRVPEDEMKGAQEYAVKLAGMVEDQGVAETALRKPKDEEDGDAEPQAPRKKGRG